MSYFDEQEDRLLNQHASRAAEHASRAVEPVPEPKPPICDMKVGDEVDQPLLVASAEAGVAKNGKPFVKAVLMDRTGEVPAMAFDLDTVPEPGVHHVTGKVDEFNGLQIKVSSFGASDAPVEQFVRASRYAPVQLRTLLSKQLLQLTGELGDVVRAVFDEQTTDAFLTTPAAQRNHHAYRGGLAEHTLSMVGLARRVCEHYATFYDDPIDVDLVVAGVLLHDLGKVVELQPDGFAWEQSIEGELVGHISEVACRIHDACMATAASPQTRARLLHVVLAHHGQYAWGSPVEPRMFEAQLVHLVDMIDSRASMFRDAVAGLEPGQRSEYVRPLRGRVVR